MGTDQVPTDPMEIELLRLFVQAMLVDGEIAPSEVEKLTGLAEAVGWDMETISKTIEEEMFQPSQLQSLTQKLTDDEARSTAVTVCAGIVAADGKFEDKERGFMIELCEALDFDPSGLVEAVEEALASPEAFEE